MRSPLVAALSRGACFGLAFAPPGSLQLGVGRHAPRVYRRLSTQFLFSPEHGDHAGPIAVVTSKKEGSDKTVGPTSAGGWGSWEKVVSQRKEQDGVLQKFSSQGGVDVESGLLVRTAQKDDMFSISHLCVDTFRGPFQWFEFPLQLFQVLLSKYPYTATLLAVPFVFVPRSWCLRRCPYSTFCLLYKVPYRRLANNPPAINSSCVSHDNTAILTTSLPRAAAASAAAAVATVRSQRGRPCAGKHRRLITHSRKSSHLR